VIRFKHIGALTVDAVQGRLLPAIAALGSTPGALPTSAPASPPAPAAASAGVPGAAGAAATAQLAK